tara:strand:- start:116 stop:472 length:357 start_codon:yes stop_codon:yes gene_type:complete
MTKFKDEYSFEERCKESTKIKEKYPNRIPIIVEKLLERNSTDIPVLDKKKYLVPMDITVGQFTYILRKRIKLAPEQALFLFVNDNIPPSSQLIQEIYNQYKDTDNFLYILYSGENTFG